MWPPLAFPIGRVPDGLLQLRERRRASQGKAMQMILLGRPPAAAHVGAKGEHLILQESEKESDASTACWSTRRCGAGNPPLLSLHARPSGSRLGCVTVELGVLPTRPISSFGAGDGSRAGGILRTVTSQRTGGKGL